MCISVTKHVITDKEYNINRLIDARLLLSFQNVSKKGQEIPQSDTAEKYMTKASLHYWILEGKHFAIYTNAHRLLCL